MCVAMPNKICTIVFLICYTLRLITTKWCTLNPFFKCWYRCKWCYNCIIDKSEDMMTSLGIIFQIQCCLPGNDNLNEITGPSSLKKS